MRLAHHSAGDDGGEAFGIENLVRAVNDPIGQTAGQNTVVALVKAAGSRSRGLRAEPGA